LPIYFFIIINLLFISGQTSSAQEDGTGIAMSEGMNAIIDGTVIARSVNDAACLPLYPP